MTTIGPGAQPGLVLPSLSSMSLGAPEHRTASQAAPRGGQGPNLAAQLPRGLRQAQSLWHPSGPLLSEAVGVTCIIPAVPPYIPLNEDPWALSICPVLCPHTPHTSSHGLTIALQARLAEEETQAQAVKVPTQGHSANKGSMGMRTLP